MTVYIVARRAGKAKVIPGTLIGDVDGNPARKRVLVNGREEIHPAALVHPFLAMAKLMAIRISSEEIHW